MKLSPEVERYADDYYWIKAREIYEESREEINNRKFVSHEETEQADYLIRAKAAAKTIEARIESYLLAYEKEGKLIDDEDRSEIFEKTNRIIELQVSQVFSGSQGTITMVRNQWSSEHVAVMKDYFRAKVKHLAEPAFNRAILKITEMKMNKTLEKQVENRYQVLRLLYDEVGDNQHIFVDLRSFTDKTNLTEKELSILADYLEEERLIKQIDDSGLLINITHKGIIEIEKSINSPQSNTEHFSSSIIQHFHGTIGAVQTGNSNTANVQQNFDTKTEDVLKLLDRLREHIPETDRQEGNDYIEGLQAEVKSETPSKSRMKLYLGGLTKMATEIGKEIITDITAKLIMGQV